MHQTMYMRYKAVMFHSISWGILQKLLFISVGTWGGERPGEIDNVHIQDSDMQQDKDKTGDA
jgi:hypothetical protein